MNWGIITSVFFLSTFKFMFAGIPGAIAGIPAWQTFLASTLGGSISAAFFYFSAEGLMMLNRKKKAKKMEEALRMNIPMKKKKSFTFFNKLVVRIKRSLGIIGISFWAPLFLSVPIGSVVAAKFYGKKRITFPLILLGMCINGIALTSLYYLIY